MADTSPFQPDFVRDLKFSAGSTAIITIGGIATAMLAECIVWIAHYYDATVNVLGCVSLLVSGFVVVAMTRLPSEFSISLLRYLLVFAAIFLGFIYSVENTVLFGMTIGLWAVRLVSIGLIAIACLGPFPNVIKLIMYVLAPILILGFLANKEIIPNWLFMVLTVAIIFIFGLTLLIYYK